MKHRVLRAIPVLLSATLLAGCAGGQGQPMTDPEAPASITLWHYYNGAQLEAFDALVEEFNATAGKELGIRVDSFSQGTVADLAGNVLDAVNRKAGAAQTPNIFAAYSDTVYQVDQLGHVVDLAPYLTEAEQRAFVPGYLEEGDFGDGTFKIFPVAKSVELLMLNRTTWDAFAQATGATVDRLTTFEGVTETARQYYEWTDAATPEPEDGSAFFGRDALANYMLIGACQLGTELFSLEDGAPRLDFDKATVRRLWDNYYIPYMNGYFTASGRFRSDDIKTGNIVAFVGASSGATFFPKEVYLSDTESFPIEMQALPCPQFSGGAAYAVQQGAGMVVTRQSEAEIWASVEFLKWFAEPDHNIGFSVGSGYLPVTQEANRLEAITDRLPDAAGQLKDVLTVSLDTVNGNALYTPKAFAGGSGARQVLESAMQARAQTDQATVRSRLASGLSREEATAEFTSDGWFDSWYDATLAELEAFFQ